MIFAKTINAVFSGRKTQTCRLVYAGDTLRVIKPDKKKAFHAPAVVRDDGRVRWVVGNVYAVQRERCHFAEGHIRILSLARVEDFTEQARFPDFARREGFDSSEDCIRVWHELHRSEPHWPVWAIGFELVRAAGKAEGRGMRAES